MRVSGSARTALVAHRTTRTRTRMGPVVAFMDSMRRRLMFVDTDRVGRWPKIRIVILKPSHSGNGRHASGGVRPSPPKPEQASG